MRVAQPIVLDEADSAEAGAASAWAFDGGAGGAAQPHRFVGCRWACRTSRSPPQLKVSYTHGGIVAWPLSRARHRRAC